MSEMITVKAYQTSDKGAADSPEYRTYQVPLTQGMSALNVMRYIYEELDSSFAFPLCLCRIGKCGGCAIKLNGRPVLACTEIIRETGEYTIEPVNDRNVVRNLIQKQN